MKKLITKLTTLLIAVTLSTSLMAQMTLVFTTTEDDQSITLPLYGTVNVTVDWGDPSPNNEVFNTTGDKTHTYSSEGTYTVKISGTLTQFGNGPTAYANADKLIQVTSFGDIGLTSIRGAFHGTTNLEQVPTSLPATITDLTYTFRNTGKESITGLNNWVVSNVTLMYGVFYEATAFNQYIGGWNVSNVTTMNSMFYNAAAFNQNIGSWNVSNVTSMSKMFYGTDAFNGNIGGWERTNPTTSTLVNVTDMGRMFQGASSFNQDIGDWIVSNVDDMEYMFKDAILFNQDISDWDVSKVEDMYMMFQNARVFNSPLNDWEVGEVENMGYMFNDAWAFNQPLNSWEVGAITHWSGLSGMFRNANAFNQSLNDWDVSSIVNMSYMFYSADVFNGDISDWEVGAVTNMSNMFYYAGDFNQDISGWDVSAVEDMSKMFYNADAFNQNINSWTVSSVENMSGMFGYSAIFNKPLNNWNVSSVTNMSQMFMHTPNFDQDLSSWNVSNVTSMSDMFTGVTLSTANYNSLLIGWETLDLYDGVTFSGGDSKYSPGVAAEAKASIISTDSWIITDDGEETSITWDGTTDSDWNTETNWSGDAVPEITSNVVIPVVATTYPEIATDGTASCNNLTIYSGATLTINSSNSGTGSLIVNESSMGNVTAKRYVDVIAKADKWHYVSSPVSGQTLDGTWMSINNIANTPSYQFFRYDEATNYWIIYGSTGIPVAFNDITFVEARGYCMSTSGAQALSFIGTVRTDNVNYATTYTVDNGEGCNLVGNPFTSSIGITSDASTDANFLAVNTDLLDNSYKATYIWDEVSGYDGTNQDYKTISNAATGGSELSNNYIQPGQAFMVKVVSGGGALAFNENMQAHSTDAFYKEEKETWPSVELIVENDELFNSTAIGFNDNMTLGLDPSYDVGKLKGNPNIALYTRLVEDNGVDFAIQALPTNNSADYIIPVGLDILEETLIEFSINTEALEETDIIFEDRENGSFTDIKKESYSTTVSESGTGRFFLHIGNVNSVENPIEKTNISAYFVGNNLLIKNPENQKGEYQLFDLQGKIAKAGTLNGSKIETKNANIPTGVYILKIKTNLENRNVKIVKM